MFQSGSGVRAARVLLAALVWAFALAAPAVANDVILYRVFLVDGTAAVSYGEFAHVAGSVVFSMPLGGLDTDTPQLQLVSLPEASVDWPRTEAYAESARAKHFVDTRAEAEFSRLSEAVAGTLNKIAFTEDAAARLAMADRARQLLADWPARNYGYRASDVAQLAGLLDEVVSELSVEQAFMLSRVSQDAAQRASLLRGITDALVAPARDGGWAAALRARATADLIAATRIDQAYADLSSRMIKTADDRVRQADVKGVESLIRDVLKADDRLGRQRPQETAALLATMDQRLNAARRLRLSSDRWALSQGVVRAYERKAKPALDVLSRARVSLEQIRQLAGPSSRTLRQLQKTAGVASREFALIKPAPEVEAINGLLSSAFQMAMRAVDTRMSAVNANDMSLAWQASSAAAGALLLLDRARDELQRLRIPPVQ